MKWDGVEYDENGQKIFEIKNGEGKGKLYDDKNNLIFDGEIKKGKYWNGKVYEYDYEMKINNNNKIKFEGVYENGELKQGKKYENGEIIFEGEYKQNKEWTGKLKNYKIDKNYIILQGELSEGKWSGKGKEFDSFGYAIYEGQFLEGKRNGEGIEYISDGF